MQMEYASIEREIHVDAAPEVVFEVISSPEHIREWWDAETELEPRSGATGRLTWGEQEHVTPVTVVVADPPRVFSFRWAYDEQAAAAPEDGLLVTFELTPAGEGTTLRLTETGFREQGWEAAVLEEQYLDHVAGWDTFVPRIGALAETLVSR
jgi:uncharacterized protein YndB with AHSA1/START domain